MLKTHGGLLFIFIVLMIFFCLPSNKYVITIEGSAVITFTPPSILSYEAGDLLNLTGFSVISTVDETPTDITDMVTIEPDPGIPFTGADVTNGVTYTVSYGE